MKQVKVSIVLATVAIVLAACSTGSAAPKCSDQKVVDALSHIVFDDFVKKAAKQREDLPKMMQPTPEGLAEYDAEIAKATSLLKSAKRVYTNIVMKDTNEKTGAHTCAATEEASITAEGQTISDKKNFTYTVEKTDDGNNFIITTQGLIR